jgi:hypothetical protein
VKPLLPTLLAFAAVFCLGGRALPAENPPGALTFTWSAPETCPSRAQVLAELTRLLGGTILMAPGDDLEVRATVEHGRVWSVVLATRRAGRAEGRRSLDAPSCPSLAEATALIVALMIDPDAVAAHAEDAKPDASSVTPPPTQDAVPESSSATTFLVSIHTQTRLGTLPGLDVGLGLGAGIARGRWMLEVRGTYGLRRDQAASLSSEPDAGGRFNIMTGALSGCFDLGQASLGFGPCALVEAGWVSAKGYGADAGYSKSAPWVALGGGGFLSLMLGRHLEAALNLDVLAPLWRPSYVFAGTSGSVFQAPPVGARALASIMWRF